jgi:hypothetical protein
MNEQEKPKSRRPARFVLYIGAPLAALALVFGALYLFGDAKSSRAASGLKINHKFKTETVGLSCDTCHDVNATNAKLMSFPNHDTCIACHADAIDENSDKKNCELCHTQADYKTHVRKDQVISPLVKFNHQPHQKAGVDCVSCHTTFDKDVLTGDEMIPTMDTCIKCHTDKQVKGGTACNFCHVKGVEKLKPQTHSAAAWKTVHGAGLNKDLIDANCKVCHTKEQNNSCTKCHHQAPLTIGKTVACTTCHGTAVDKTRPQDHNPLWVTSHGKNLSQAKIDQKCSLCHNQASGNDCQSCHRREAPKNHTIGWSQNLHGNAARTNRQSCATCHDQSECISCHTTTPPFTHTGTWGTPYDRHCINCHIEGGNYAGGGIGGNCGVCHKSTDIYAKHQNVRGHTGGVLCLTCHNGSTAVAISHPTPVVTSCATCHPFP